MSGRTGARWTAVGRTALVVACTVTSPIGTDRAFVVPVTVAALVCGAVLLVPRLRWPVAPAVVSLATAWWGLPLLPLLVIALFGMAVDLRWRAALGWAAVALAGNLLSYRETALWTSTTYASVLLLPGLAVVGGLWRGNRRRLLDALTADLAHLRVAAELREDAARAAERSRIAAEMHDVLAHRLSLIALHTGVLTTKGGLPAPVAERLALLRETSVEALTDLREVLGALRETGSPELRPAVRDVRELVEEARGAGQQVVLVSDGTPSLAPTTHRLAVYRLVREALTNARKHADGAPVTVRVSYDPPDTLVEVTNPPGGSRTDADGSGYGLVGLRERVGALGGEFSAGPVGAGVWRLAARLPHPSVSPRQP
ncbi:MULTISPECIES: histidine kinase [unclassified Streptomyces]|uniref:sensor histidine kinase n=1 Tax=unclassified Streptomyces TaxID=2593676 RepID=UPI00292E1A02|nr:histidine kinase [Streptomyces sp. ST1015]